MRILIAALVAHPHDARILHRQVPLMVDEGWEVTYAAPWTVTGAEPPEDVTALDLPRAEGRDRLGAIRRARRVLAEAERGVDLVLLTDVDLLAAVAGRARTVPHVWDVREDTAAALDDRAWLPAWARPAARAGVRAAERWAERRLHLVLTDPDYQERFTRPHPVVPNDPWVPETVPPPGVEPVVHLGRLSWGRGARELVALGAELRDEVAVHLIGGADPDVRGFVEDADRRGDVVWHGYVRNDRALGMLDGALAGVSLIHDQPNYRAATPTKLLEYMARGVPVVTTPLPRAAELVDRHGCGEVVAFGDVGAAAAAVRRLRDDGDLRRGRGAAGHGAAREHHDWRRTGRGFLRLLERWATELR